MTRSGSGCASGACEVEAAGLACSLTFSFSSFFFIYFCSGDRIQGPTRAKHHSTSESHSQPTLETSHPHQKPHTNTKSIRRNKVPNNFSNSLLGYLTLTSHRSLVPDRVPSASSCPPNSRSLASETNGKISQGVCRILAPDRAGESRRTASSSSSVGVSER